MDRKGRVGLGQVVVVVGGGREWRERDNRGNQRRCRAWLWGHKTGAGVNPNEKMEIAEGRVKEIEDLETWLFMVLRYSLEDP